MTLSGGFPLEQQLREAWPPTDWADCHVLVAVSGGADSVALLRATLALRKEIEGRGSVFAAHYNHRWRGAESDGDAQFVADLCQQMGIPLHAGAAPSASPHGGEAEAREARYQFLEQAARQVGARYVATGHTADDQIETLLLRIFRGTGLTGLAGIPRYRPLGESATLVRPLLSVRRSEVEAYLTALGQEYRTDASNQSNTFTRNWIRNELLPLVRRELPYPVDAALLRLGSQAAEWRAATEELVEHAAGQHVRFADNPPRLELDCQPLAALPPMVVQEACRLHWRRAGWPEQGMGHDDWKRLAEATRTGGSVPMLPGGFVALRQGELLVVTAAGDASVGTG